MNEQNVKTMAKRLARELQRYDMILSHTKCLEVIARIHDLPNFNAVKHPDPETIPHYNQTAHNQVTLTSHQYGYAVKGNSR